MALGKECAWEWLCPLGFPGDCFCPQGVFSEAGAEAQTSGRGGQGLLCALAHLSPSLSQAFSCPAQGYTQGPAEPAAFVAVQGPLKMGLWLSGPRPRMGSPWTDHSIEGGGGLGCAGHGFG